VKQDVPHGEVVGPKEVASRLEAVGWGLFFAWLGVAFLTGLGFGVGLLGVAIITLGMQLARLAFKLKIEGFWVVAGLVFLVGSIWELLNIGIDFVAILLVVAGIVLLLSGIARSRRTATTP
jgi:hypothetical protein